MSSKIMLDSGAYSAWTKGRKINIDEYAQFIKDNENTFDFCINLDVIGEAKGSYENWKYLRSLGVNVLPVYHIGTDEMWLKKYLKQTDYVCLGAIASLSSAQRMQSLTRIWQNYLTDPVSQLPIVKVHGLGVTAISIMLRYPWYSVDSITPVIGAAYGRIFLPRYKQIDGVDSWSYFDGFFCAISNQAKHNVGTTTSFPGLPVFVQEKYMKFIEAHGFNFGNLYYQKRKQTRRDKREGKEDQPGMFSVHQQESTEEPQSLANSWNERLQFNTFTWNQLIDRIPAYPRKHQPDVLPIEESHGMSGTTVYYGISTNSHINMMKEVKPQPDILVSYAYMTEKLCETVKQYKI